MGIGSSSNIRYSFSDNIELYHSKTTNKIIGIVKKNTSLNIKLISDFGYEEPEWDSDNNFATVIVDDHINEIETSYQFMVIKRDLSCLEQPKKGSLPQYNGKYESLHTKCQILILTEDLFKKSSSTVGNYNVSIKSHREHNDDYFEGFSLINNESNIKVEEKLQEITEEIIKNEIAPQMLVAVEEIKLIDKCKIEQEMKQKILNDETESKTKVQYLLNQKFLGDIDSIFSIKINNQNCFMFGENHMDRENYANTRYYSNTLLSLNKYYKRPHFICVEGGLCLMPEDFKTNLRYTMSDVLRQQYGENVEMTDYIFRSFKTYDDVDVETRKQGKVNSSIIIDVFNKIQPWLYYMLGYMLNQPLDQSVTLKSLMPNETDVYLSLIKNDLDVIRNRSSKIQDFANAIYKKIKLMHDRFKSNINRFQSGYISTFYIMYTSCLIDVPFCVNIQYFTLIERYDVSIFAGAAHNINLIYMIFADDDDLLEYVNRYIDYVFKPYLRIFAPKDVVLLKIETKEETYNKLIEALDVKEQCVFQGGIGGIGGIGGVGGINNNVKNIYIVLISLVILLLILLMFIKYRKTKYFSDIDNDFIFSKNENNIY